MKKKLMFPILMIVLMICAQTKYTITDAVVYKIWQTGVRIPVDAMKFSSDGKFRTIPLYIVWSFQNINNSL